MKLGAILLLILSIKTIGPALSSFIFEYPTYKKNPYFFKNQNEENYLAVPALASGKFLSGVIANSTLNVLLPQKLSWKITRMPEGWQLLSPQGDPISPESQIFDDPSNIILKAPGIPVDPEPNITNNQMWSSTGELGLQVTYATFAENIFSNTPNSFLENFLGTENIQTKIYLIGKNLGNNTDISPPYFLTGGKYSPSKRTKTTLPNIFYNNYLNERPNFITASVRIPKNILGEMSVNWSFEDSNPNNIYKFKSALNMTQKPQKAVKFKSLLHYVMDTSNNNSNNSSELDIQNGRIRITTKFIVKNGGRSFYVGYLCFCPNSVSDIPYAIFSKRPLVWKLIQPIDLGSSLFNFTVPKKKSKKSQSAVLSLNNNLDINLFNQNNFHISILRAYEEEPSIELLENPNLINFNLSRTTGNYIDFFNGLTLTTTIYPRTPKGNYRYLLRAQDSTGALAIDYPFFIVVTTADNKTNLDLLAPDSTQYIRDQTYLSANNIIGQLIKAIGHCKLSESNESFRQKWALITAPTSEVGNSMSVSYDSTLQKWQIKMGESNNIYTTDPLPDDGIFPYSHITFFSQSEELGNIVLQNISGGTILPSVYADVGPGINSILDLTGVKFVLSNNLYEAINSFSLLISNPLNSVNSSHNFPNSLSQKFAKARSQIQ